MVRYSKMGGGDDTPTGGNGMNVDNVPDNVDGKLKRVRIILLLNLQFNFQIDKKIYLKRRLRNKRNS